MKRFVYIVLSHDDVALVRRLTATIRRMSADALILVHHDRSKSDLPDRFFAGDPRVVVLTPSIAGAWGSFALVEMVLLALGHLRRTEEPFDYVTLLSGADYPLRPLAAYENALVASRDGMMRSEPAPAGIRDRYAFAWYRLPRVLESAIAHRVVGALARLNGRQPFVRFQSGRVGCRIGMRSRGAPFGAGLEIVKGSQWWALSARAVACIEAYVRDHPAYVAWFRERTLIPDEAFFHTIVLSSPALDVAEDDGRFVRWSRPGSGSPDVLGLSDLDELRASGAFFARKFDSRRDARILDALDAELDVRHI